MLSRMFRSIEAFVLVIVAVTFSLPAIAIGQGDTYTASFVSRKSYSIQQGRLVEVAVPDKEFQDRRDINPVHLKLLRNGEPHNDSRIDATDFTVSVTDSGGTAITGATAAMSSFRAFAGSYQFNISAPENTGVHDAGKVIVTLNANAIPGLASVSREFVFSYPPGYGANMNKLTPDFIVLGPREIDWETKEVYYENGQGDTTDPDLKDLDPEAVILSIIWKDAQGKSTDVTGVTTSDIKVEIDYDGDSIGYQEVSGHVSVPVYPSWAPLTPAESSSQEFKLKIPATGSGKIKVYVRENATDGFTNEETPLSLYPIVFPVSPFGDRGVAQVSYLRFGPPLDPNMK